MEILSKPIKDQYELHLVCIDMQMKPAQTFPISFL